MNDLLHGPSRATPSWSVLAGVLLLAALAGCASLSSEEAEEKRSAIDASTEATIAQLLEQHPEVRERLEQAPGYAVADMKVTKIPWFGGGGGTGVVVDQRTDARTYVRVSRFEVGAGLGVQAFRAVVLFTDPALLDRAMTGFWHVEGSGEAAAGDKGVEGKVPTERGYEVFKISEGGIAVTATLRLVQAKPFLQ